MRAATTNPQRFSRPGAVCRILAVLCLIVGGTPTMTFSFGSLALRPVRPAEELPTEENSHNVQTAAVSSHAARRKCRAAHGRFCRPRAFDTATRSLLAAAALAATSPSPQEHALRFGLGTPLRI